MKGNSFRHQRAGTPGWSGSRAWHHVLAIALVLTTLAAPLSIGAAAPAASPRSPLLPREQMAAQTLIQAGLIQGAFDYPTSLVYRAYALFGDPALPAELRGAGSVGEDQGLFLESRRNWNRLPQSVQDRLTPFTVRPTDPRSRFFRSSAAPTTDPSTVDAGATAQDGDCVDTWTWRDSPNYHYKVWMHCTGDVDDDLDAAIELIDSFWDREVELMREPLPDSGSEDQGGDTRIDFYFLDGEGDVAARPGGFGIEESVAAYAVSQEPVVGTGSSAFVVARRPYIGDPQLSLTICHEFFHVLQYAYNWQIAFGFMGTPYTSEFDVLSFVEAWFVEATADWMKSYIWRDILSTEDMQEYLHIRYLVFFQGLDVSLILSTSQSSSLLLHSYASYVYFLFLEQELGPEAIGDFWTDLQDVEPDDFTRMAEILNDQLPFEEHFRDFAVRNFNSTLEPGDPFGPRFQDVDPTFPESKPPYNFAEGQNGRLPLLDEGDEPKVYEDRIPNLAAHYFEFSPASDADYVTLDFSGLAPSEHVDIDLLVKIRDGEWERRQYAADEPITFCRNEPDQNVGRIYAIVSNHAMEFTDVVRGSFTAGAYRGSCP